MPMIEMANVNVDFLAEFAVGILFTLAIGMLVLGLVFGSSED